MLAFFLLLACSTEAPVVDSVSPANGQPGTAVRVEGDHFSKGTVVRVGRIELDDLVVDGPTVITGAVPMGLAPGYYDVVVSGPDGRATTTKNAFTVDGPDVSPCLDPVQTFAHIPPSAEVVKIDRHYPEPDKRVVNTRIKKHEIDAVEYEARLLDDKRLCSAIYIRTKDGRRYLFDADADQVLKGQAQMIANGLGKPIDVLHEDELPKDEGGATP